MPERHDIYIVLDNVKYNHNVGPIFRIADGIGAKKVYLCRDNKLKFKPNQLEIIKKSSRGASNIVDWELKQDAHEVVMDLKQLGCKIISLDIRAEKYITEINEKLDCPVVIVFGSESNGIDPKIVDISDEVVKLPMLGKLSSLNVASCVAVVGYKILEMF